MTTAIYPGSFDPLTNGHLDVITRVNGLFENLIVAVLDNPDKHPLFSVGERKDMIAAATEMLPHVAVDSFSGLLVEYARLKGANVIVRGLREIGDFENELKMAQMNRQLNSTAVTLFVPTSPACSYLSSSLIKQVARFGGDISGFVPEPVARAIRGKHLAP